MDDESPPAVPVLTASEMDAREQALREALLAKVQRQQQQQQQQHDNNGRGDDSDSRWAETETEEAEAAAANEVNEPSPGTLKRRHTESLLVKSKWAVDDSDDEEPIQRKPKPAAKKAKAAPAAPAARVATPEVPVVESPQAARADTPQAPDTPEGTPEVATVDPAALARPPPLPVHTPPVLSACRSVELYDKLNKIDEGAYGIVYRAKDRATGRIVALKRLKIEKEREGFPITSLREINTLLLAHHPNIVNVLEIVVGADINQIYIVMEYVEHDVKWLMSNMKAPFRPSEVKTIMLQLLSAVGHLHENWIIHRDLKTSNMLFTNNGQLKLADFGLARLYGDPMGNMTPLVVTLWYRAPELLLGGKTYSVAIDMWAVGCIFYELITRKPLFPGTGEIDQINKIFGILGKPTEQIWPGFSKLPHVQKINFANQPYNFLRQQLEKDDALFTASSLDLLNKLLFYDPEQRYSAEQALNHPYFQEAPYPKAPSEFPTWPSRGEREHKRVHDSPTAPNNHPAQEDEEEAHIRELNEQTGLEGFKLRF